MAAPREAFLRWAQALPEWAESPRRAQLARFEDVRLPSLADEVRGLGGAPQGELLLEVVLHGNAATTPGVLDDFLRYLDARGVKAECCRTAQVGGLTYVALRAHRTAVEDISGYSFLRVVRPMSRLR